MLETLALQEVGADIGLVLDRIVVAEHAVGDQRVARDHVVFVELHRVQTDDRDILRSVPFERGRARRLLAGRDRVRKDITFDKGFEGTDLHVQPPVDVEGSTKGGDEQHEQPIATLWNIMSSYPVYLRMISSENRYPLFRIMRA